MSDPFIDVSTWNGSIDWPRVRASGVGAAMIRAGYGKNHLDGKFRENARNAAAAGLDVGFYWFSYALTAAEARAEADYLCDAVESVGVAVRYPLAFDYEYDSVAHAKRNGGATDRETMVSLAEAFLERVEERGYYAVNYTNVDFLRRGFDALTNRFDTWLAQWGVSKPSYACGLWQYASNGAVSGITGNVDMDVAFRDYPALIGGDRTPATPVEPDPYPYGKASETTGNVRKGAKHDGVKAIQYALNALGYGNAGTEGVDGRFGALTEAAVRAFQKARGIRVDGIVGDQTRREFQKLGY